MDADKNGNFNIELPELPKSRPRKPAAKRAKDGEEKVAKAPRKTATKKDPVEGETQPKKPRKPRAKVADQDGDGPSTKEAAPRKPRIKKPEKQINADEGSKEKPTRKVKAKKAEGESQTKLSKCRVTKASSKSSSDKVDKTLKSTKPESAPAEFLDQFIDSLDYGLVEAVKRRTDWTPPRPTKATDITPVSTDQLDNTLASSGLIQSAESTKGFADLFGSFGFTKVDNNAVGKKPLEIEAPRKRKLIELIKTSVSTAAAASPKEKAIKKKARTITDQATSAYAEEEESPAKPAPLLQYFSYQTMERDINDGFKAPPKPRSKSPVKEKSKAKKGSVQAPILLSPESALKQSVNQDFVFGTSSQLAREDSPTLLRDLHEAMQTSNEVDDDPFADSIYESEPVAFANRGRAGPPTKRNLWSAAARDDAGELHGLEVSHDLEELGKLAPAPRTTRELPKAVGHIEAAIKAELFDSPHASRSANESSKNAQAAKNNKSPSRPSESSGKTSKKAAKSADHEKPDFSSYTTAQLAKEIASYRFKPIKNRDQMIILLEKCWEGKNRIALGALGTNVMSSAPIESSKAPAPAPAASQSSSPKRPRGRPRKESAAVSPPKAKVGRPKAPNSVELPETDSGTSLPQVQTPRKSKKKAKEPVEDISDSDTQVTPSPPRRHASQLKTLQLPLKLSISAGVDTSLELSQTTSQNNLFTHITNAVRNAPPSKNVSKPSWHEKILLYDPIILEDLTVWLNTGALEKVGWDGEVEPREVKKWCESKSICCLWRENLRGGARSRY